MCVSLGVFFFYYCPLVGCQPPLTQVNRIRLKYLTLRALPRSQIPHPRLPAALVCLLPAAVTVCSHLRFFFPFLHFLFFFFLDFK